jgi:predicted ATPase
MALKNVRLFEETGQIELAPVTLVFGKNSSGKTTLLRAPLLFREFLSGKPTRDVPLAGAGVDFGSYRDLVYEGDVRRDVELGLSFSLDATEEIVINGAEAESPLGALLGDVRVDVVLHWNVRNSRTQFERISFFSLNDPSLRIDATRQGPSAFRLEIPAIRYSRPLSGATLNFRNLLFAPRLGRPARRRRPEEYAEFFIFVLINRLQETVADLVHVGPLRDMPQRAYGTTIQSQTARSGIGTADVVSASREAIQLTATALRELGIAENVSVVQLAPGYVGVVLTDPISGAPRNLADVGFGASQVLPILVTVASAQPETLVLIEQPELHLHPETQGALADVLMRLAAGRGVSLFIESHSEHILLRVQRRIAEGVLKPADVAAYIVDGGKVMRSQIDRLGRLDTTVWPDGFFEEEWTDALRLAEAAAETAKQ